MGTREQDKFAQTSPRTHMHQDVIEAKKEGKSAVPKKTAWVAHRTSAGLFCIALGRLEKRVGVVGGRL